MMGKMVENPRYRVMSFRVTDAEYALLIGAKPSGCAGTFLRDLALAGLATLGAPAPSPALPSHAAAASDHGGSAS